MQSGADLEVGKWVPNGYELKLKLKKWPQDKMGEGVPALRVTRT